MCKNISSSRNIVMHSTIVAPLIKYQVLSAEVTKHKTKVENLLVKTVETTELSRTYKIYIIFASYLYIKLENNPGATFFISLTATFV